MKQNTKYASSISADANSILLYPIIVVGYLGQLLCLDVNLINLSLPTKSKILFLSNFVQFHL